MYPLTSRDLWFTTPPDEAEQAAWEEYADRYHDRAAQIVLDYLTESVPTRDVDRTNLAVLLAALAGVVRGLDTAMVTAWACELSDEIPAFEQWWAEQGGRAA